MGIFSGIVSALGGAAGIGSSIAKGLGGLAKSAGGTFLGRSIDRYGDNRAMRDQWDFYSAQGLTPQEIMGAGGVGTGSSAGSTVLGNQAAQQHQMEQQRAFQQEESAKDRALGLSGQLSQLEAARTTAGAMTYGAKLNYDASMNQSATNFDIAAMQNDRAWQQMANDWANDNPQLNAFFKEMSMGVENVKMFYLARRHGLTATAKLSPDEFDRRYRNMMSELAVDQGWGQTLREGFNQWQRGYTTNSVLTPWLGSGSTKQSQLPVGIPMPSLELGDSTNTPFATR